MALERCWGRCLKLQESKKSRLSSQSCTPGAWLPEMMKDDVAPPEAAFLTLAELEEVLEARDSEDSSQDFFMRAQ